MLYEVITSTAVQQVVRRIRRPAVAHGERRGGAGGDQIDRRVPALFREQARGTQSRSKGRHHLGHRPRPARRRTSLVV